MASTVIYVRSDCLGADETIGYRLMQSFWNSFPVDQAAAVTVFFMNRGVFLGLEGSPVLAALRRLEVSGCRILSCGTCLDYFEVEDRLVAGEVGTMAGLQQLMRDADKVITL